MKDAEAELADLRRKLENYNKDKASLNRMSTKYGLAHKELNEMKWETEALQMRCTTLTDERDLMKEKFEEAILELQQRTGLKNVLLERKLATLEKESEKREAILGDILISSGLDPQKPNIKLEKLIQQKNDRIQDLLYELARVCKAHDDLLTTYEAKLLQFGIPKEELGFQPLRTIGHMKLGVGPAGLVSKQT